MKILDWKTKNRTTMWPSSSTPGSMFEKKKKTKTLIQKDMHPPKFKKIRTPNVHSSKSHNFQDIKAMEVSNNRWMDKEDVVYIHHGILISHKKNENLPFAATWMELEGILLSERRQTEEYKHCVMSLTCGI